MALHQLFRHPHNAQGFQAQKVKLHQARRFGITHAKLRGRHQRAGVHKQTAHLRHRAVGNNHARCVRAGMAVASLQLAGNVQQAAHIIFRVIPRAQAFIVCQHLIQRWGGRPFRNQRRNLPDKIVGQAQHTPHIAQARAGFERTKRNDLRHLVCAKAFAHIGNHLFAAVLAKVDIKIGQAHAVGVQKTLEIQFPPQGVQVGDL